ncbi:MAG: hypothetical protein LBS21_15695 [Clostridiales bacterium]|jgi:flagellar hook-associated protein 2|nr:hypothetical protein [Clostridiales bacterium]
MAVNTDYSVYSGYSDLLNSLSGTSSNSKSSESKSSSDLLVKLNDFTNGYGYKVNSDKYVTEDVQKYLSDIKSESSKLASTLADLLGRNKSKTSTFEEKSLVSSNSDALSVSTGYGYKNALGDTEIKINQIATGQINKSDTLNSGGKTLSAGSYQFEIETADGKKHQIAFKVNANDDNEAVQKKIAEVINSKDIGIKASVSVDDTKKTSQLSIESTTTGADNKNSFKIRDVSSAGGDAAAKLGLAEVDQKAQDAIYSINGGALKTSKSNKIDVGDGVTATLKKATTDSVKISEATDDKSTINKVREMVNGFNGMLAAADDNKSDRGAARLMKQLQGLSSSYDAALERIGISVSAEGYLSIDEDKMSKAAESGELEKFFTSNGEANYGFANKLERLAKNVDSDPTDYLSSTSMQTAASVDSYNKKNTISFLQSYKMSAVENTGMLFDYMF